MTKIFGLVGLIVISTLSFVAVTPVSAHAQVVATREVLSSEDAVLLKQTLDAVQATLMILEQRIDAGIAPDESQVFLSILDSFELGLARVSEITLAFDRPSTPSIAIVPPRTLDQKISVQDIIGRGVNKDEVLPFRADETQVVPIVTVKEEGFPKKVLAIIIVLAFVFGVLLFRRSSRDSGVVHQKVVSSGSGPSSS